MLNDFNFTRILGFIKSIHDGIINEINENKPPQEIFDKTCKAIRIMRDTDTYHETKDMADQLLIELANAVRVTGDIHKGLIRFAERLKSTLCEYGNMTEGDFSDDEEEAAEIYYGNGSLVELSAITGERKEALKRALNNSKPTDRISLSEEVLYKLETFWNKEQPEDVDEGSTVLTAPPADILWANTIPIKDCIIDFPYDNGRKNAAGIRDIRITITDDCTSNLTAHMCGIVTITTNGGYQLAGVFGVHDSAAEDANLIDIPKEIAFITAPMNQVIRQFEEDPNGGTLKTAETIGNIMRFLSIWYGLQVALLNPKIKNVFATHSSMSTIEDKPNRNNRKNNKRPKIKYIKRCIITDDVFKTALERSYVRTKLCWYVTGHWRNQPTKNGIKRIFIQGFWKGVARKTKTDDIRDRDVEI